LDKLVAVGVTPCKKEDHTLRTRSGHCLACNPQAITQLRRYYENSNIYVAVSKQANRLKIGYAKDIQKREVSLSGSSYGGQNDWKIIYSARCKNAGQVESEVHKKLVKYLNPSDYIMGGKVVAAYELFSCSYKTAKEAVVQIKEEFPEQFSAEEYELEGAFGIYDFPDVLTSQIRRGNDSNNEVEHAEINYPSARTSEFGNDNVSTILSESAGTQPVEDIENMLDPASELNDVQDDAIEELEDEEAVQELIEPSVSDEKVVVKYVLEEQSVEDIKNSLEPINELDNVLSGHVEFEDKAGFQDVIDPPVLDEEDEYLKEDFSEYVTDEIRKPVSGCAALFACLALIVVLAVVV
jgi:hypothetical protein